jgi:hypothetical protein
MENEGDCRATLAMTVGFDEDLRFFSQYPSLFQTECLYAFAFITLIPIYFLLGTLF